ncbi:MAG: hypothetical protein BWX64_01886 [Acidobacteria bacterium ADurb.Bin051]|nr:MAG: hypothetical protein BWX64_01886 [Acidobacteria bacterium ADurb.Bin051]
MTHEHPVTHPREPEIRRDELRLAVTYLNALAMQLQLPALLGASEALQRGDHHRWAAARAAEAAAEEEGWG